MINRKANRIKIKVNSGTSKLANSRSRSRTDSKLENRLQNNLNLTRSCDSLSNASLTLSSTIEAYSRRCDSSRRTGSKKSDKIWRPSNKPLKSSSRHKTNLLRLQAKSYPRYSLFRDQWWVEVHYRDKIKVHHCKSGWKINHVLKLSQRDLLMGGQERRIAQGCLTWSSLITQPKVSLKAPIIWLISLLQGC